MVAMRYNAGMAAILKTNIEAVKRDIIENVNRFLTMAEEGDELTGQVEQAMPGNEMILTIRIFRPARLDGKPSRDFRVIDT
jgi:hypothetical protein